jgi:hypothetical protein
MLFGGKQPFIIMTNDQSYFHHTYRLTPIRTVVKTLQKGVQHDE